MKIKGIISLLLLIQIVSVSMCWGYRERLMKDNKRQPYYHAEFRKPTVVLDESEIRNLKNKHNKNTIKSVEEYDAKVNTEEQPIIEKQSLLINEIINSKDKVDDLLMAEVIKEEVQNFNLDPEEIVEIFFVKKRIIEVQDTGWVSVDKEPEQFKGRNSGIRRFIKILGKLLDGMRTVPILPLTMATDDNWGLVGSDALWKEKKDSLLSLVKNII